MEKVTLITCYIGRGYFIKRIVASFLEQEYEGHSTLLLYHNGYGLHQLEKTPLPANRQINLVNNHIDRETGKEYTNTGAIFRDALEYVSDDTDIISFFDSDDLFLPNHVSEGVNGYKKAREQDKFAYKPKFSHHIYQKDYMLIENNMEPSIFVMPEYVQEFGFAPVSSSYHQQWLTPLQQNNAILVDPEGPATFLYDWSEGHNTFKISGANDDSEKNFKNHRNWESRFLENSIISPLTKEQLYAEYNILRNK